MGGFRLSLPCLSPKRDPQSQPDFHYGSGWITCAIWLNPPGRRDGLAKIGLFEGTDEASELETAAMRWRDDPSPEPVNEFETPG